jgi:hypothetical protein
MNYYEHPIPLLTEQNLLIAMRQERQVSPEKRQELRRKIIERAKEIGVSYIIPDNWNEDGTLK